MDETIIISLGGSLIVPNEIDVPFLQAFRSLVLEVLPNYQQIMIVAGGGQTARHYQQAAQAISPTVADDLDWLGIHSSRLNGHLLRTMFKDVADPEMITNPERMIPRRDKVLIAAGYRPGNSTDYVAALLAKAYGIKTILNLSNIEYLYDKDPKKNPDANIVKKITWKKFRAMVGNEWTPGMNVPFDPIAAKLCDELSMEVAIIKGQNLAAVRHFLSGKPFVGSLIQP